MVMFWRGSIALADESPVDQYQAQYQKPCEGALINQLALRSFRDIGDQDYIVARMAMKVRFSVQFFWSGLQAVEKYLKCILLLNRVSSRSVGHDLEKALSLVNEKLELNINLSGDELKVFQRLARSDGDRYLVNSLYLFEYELSGLDSLVWRLRQYCVPLDVEHYNDPPSEELRVRNIADINARLSGQITPERGYLGDGLLEKILSNSSSPTYNALVWHNAMFGGNEPINPEDGVGNFSAINAPLYLNPEIAEAVKELIYLPKGIVEGCKALAVERAKQNKK